MNPRKPKDEKVKNAGISLEPKLIERAKAYARKTQVGSISTLVRLLLCRELQAQEIAQWMEQGKRGPSIGFTPPPKKTSKSKKQPPKDNAAGCLFAGHTPVQAVCAVLGKKSAFNRPLPN